MAASLNKVFLVGNLTRDPELRSTKTQQQVATLGLAVNRKWTGKDGSSKEEVMFIDVKVWDRVAENCHRYLKKGNPVLIEGFLQLETWETPNNEKRSKHTIQAERVQFLSTNETGGGGSGGGRGNQAADDYDDTPAPPPQRSVAPPSRSAPAASSSNTRSSSRPSSYREPEDDGDIPF